MPHIWSTYRTNIIPINLGVKTPSTVDDEIARPFPDPKLLCVLSRVTIPHVWTTITPLEFGVKRSEVRYTGH
jgi:hypothetical protein